MIVDFRSDMVTRPTMRRAMSEARVGIESRRPLAWDREV